MQILAAPGCEARLVEREGLAIDAVRGKLLRTGKFRLILDQLDNAGEVAPNRVPCAPRDSGRRSPAAERRHTHS